MARLEVIIAGTPQDHVLRSDSLSDEDAATQLRTVGRTIGRPEFVDLPWLATAGNNVRAARVIDDEPTVRSSGGRTIMGDLANEQF